MPPSLERVRSVGPFDGWLRGAIVEMKYHGEWARAEHLAGPLAAIIAAEGVGDALVPVPLHPARLKQRGFNQSFVLARSVGKIIGVDTHDVLMRTRRTAPQVTLGADARRENVTGAFALKPGAEVSGRSLVLIDDVITTGSTLAACVETLRDGGANSVMVATIAREL